MRVEQIFNVEVGAGDGNGVGIEEFISKILKFSCHSFSYVIIPVVSLLHP